MALGSGRSEAEGLSQQFLLFLCWMPRDQAECRSLEKLDIWLSATGSSKELFDHRRSPGSSDPSTGFPNGAGSAAISVAE